MKRSILTAATLILALVPAASAQKPADHIIVTPHAIHWSPGPPALPPGAKSVLLYGDPGKPELFVLRLWLPKGYSIAPHIHPRAEVVTVLSGSLKLGFGRTADRRNAQRLPAGSFMVMPPNAPHYGFFDEVTVLQLSTTGPWAITYLNPADDPRNKGR
jgi:quercetin dioxygenase-like cupin family protein